MEASSSNSRTGECQALEAVEPQQRGPTPENKDAQETDFSPSAPPYFTIRRPQKSRDERRDEQQQHPIQCQPEGDDADIAPSAPPMEVFDSFVGYESLSFDTVSCPPPSRYGDVEWLDFSEPMLSSWTPAPENVLIHNMPHLSEPAARTALLEYVKQHCCWGVSAAKNMTITSFRPMITYHYVLHTFTEKREARWAWSPHAGGDIDGPDLGNPPPSPWEISASPTKLFCSEVKHLEVPHTATVKPCHRCKGVGTLACPNCHGKGWTRCLACHGEGFMVGTESRERCIVCGSLSHGHGRTDCTRCSAKGRITCSICDAYGQLKCFIQVTVSWLARRVNLRLSGTRGFWMKTTTTMLGRNILKELRNYDPCLVNAEGAQAQQKSNIDPIAILRKRRYGFGQTLQERPETPAPACMPDLKKAIVKALLYSPGGKPLNLAEIVDFVRRYNAFICPLSADELIYKALFELCSEKVVYRVIGTCATELRYCLADQLEQCMIQLELQERSNSCDAMNTIAQNSSKSRWSTVKKSLKNSLHPFRYTREHFFSPDDCDCSTSSDSHNSQGDVPSSSTCPCIPMKDEMILESFGSRAGLPKIFEGLQRPNTPSLGASALFNPKFGKWFAAGGSGDQKHNLRQQRVPSLQQQQFKHAAQIVQGLCGPDQPTVTNTTTTVSNWIVGKGEQAVCNSSQNSSEGVLSSSSEGTVESLTTTQESAEPLTRKSNDGSGKNLNFLKEITDILDRYEYSVAAKGRTTKKVITGEHVVGGDDLPPDLIRQAEGQVGLEETGIRLNPLPVDTIPDETLAMASAQLIQEHLENCSDSLILAQRHQVRIVPVTAIGYQWKGHVGSYFIYGLEKRVFTSDYPQTCCCGCNIL